MGDIQAVTKETVDFAREFDSKLLMTQRESYAKAFKIAEAVSGFAQWISNFAITLTFPMMLAGVGLATAYGFYSLCAVLSLFFVFWMVHETRGVELEDMAG